MVLLGVLFLGLVVGRLASVLAPIGAAFAPAVCRVCHGCGVAEHDEICDCEACQAVEEGREARAPSVHEPAHGALLEPAIAAPAAAWATPLDVAQRRTDLCRLLTLMPLEDLLPRGADPPVVPPPERAA